MPVRRCAGLYNTGRIATNYSMVSIWKVHSLSRFRCRFRLEKVVKSRAQEVGSGLRV
jgi:hypothetical protein